MGTSSWIFLIILRSMLFMYSLSVFEWLDWALFLSLVTGRLPPSSEAKRLTLSNFETTLSLQIRLELLRFFFAAPWRVYEIVWSGASGSLFHAPYISQDLICLSFDDLMGLTDFYLLFAWGIFVPVWLMLFVCALFYFLIVGMISISFEGPSVFTLRSMNKSGVWAFLVMLGCFFLLFFLL